MSMMNDMRRKLVERLWIAFPLTVLLFCGLLLMRACVPIGTATCAEGKKLYRHYASGRNAGNFSTQKQQILQETGLLDTLIQRLDQRRMATRDGLLDKLLDYADSSGFRAEKVEVSERRSFDDCIETPVTISGTGAYRSTGAFVAMIENNRQSTRITTIDITARERGEPEAFIDVTIREETAPDSSGKGK